MNGRQYARLIVLVVLVVAAFAVAACSGPTPAPATPSLPPAPTGAAVLPPAARPTQPAPASPMLPAPATIAPSPTKGLDSAGDWARIKAAGKMVVGTSADYAPFAYRGTDFNIEGYDPALIQEIGRVLGIEIEVKDFAFDGLAGALQIGQIDAAIAAITITSERSKFVSFSNPYWAGEAAILASPSYSGVTIRLAENFAGQKLGVQTGSVYETWAQKTLVDTGIIPHENLLPYADIRQAVTDLKSGKVTLVALDFAPAQTYVNSGEAKVVGRGVNNQDYAIALRLGSSLQPQVNAALAGLQANGFTAKLAEKYMDLKPADVVAPKTPEPATPEPVTATPEPAQPPTATAVPPCIDGMAWVQDLSLDDHGMTAPPIIPSGQPFTKAWRVRNSGTCPWKPGYALVYDTGNSPLSQMSGQPVKLQQEVPVNGTADLQANLIAPTEPGVYQGIWQMRNGQGVAFGERIWVGIQVPGAAPPPPPPSSTISFTANPTSVRAGDPVNFAWNAQGVKAVYFYQQGQPWEPNGVAGVGERTEYPAQTTTYELRVVKNDDSVEIRSIRIDVQANTGAPTVNYFNVNPGQIQAGQCVGVDWEVTGAINNVRVLINNNVRWDGAPTRGHLDDCPGGSGSVSYVLEARGPGGTNRQERWVNITTAPPAQAAPKIDYFRKDVDILLPGMCVNMDWGLSGGKQTRQTIDRNGKVVMNDTNARQFMDCPSVGGMLTYTLIVGNDAGEQRKSLQVQSNIGPQPR